MQLGLNVSIYRLLDTNLSEVIRDRERFAALGLVQFEIVPHYDRHGQNFIETIRRYSALIENDIWCLPDGTAVAQLPAGSIVPIGGALCMRRGEIHAPNA